MSFLDIFFKSRKTTKNTSDNNINISTSTDIMFSIGKNLGEINMSLKNNNSKLYEIEKILKNHRERIERLEYVNKNKKGRRNSNNSV